MKRWKYIPIVLLLLFFISQCTFSLTEEEVIEALCENIDAENVTVIDKNKVNHTLTVLICKNPGSTRESYVIGAAEKSLLSNKWKIVQTKTAEAMDEYGDLYEYGTSFEFYSCFSKYRYHPRTYELGRCEIIPPLKLLVLILWTNPLLQMIFWGFVLFCCSKGIEAFRNRR